MKENKKSIIGWVGVIITLIDFCLDYISASVIKWLLSVDVLEDHL